MNGRRQIFFWVISFAALFGAVSPASAGWYYVNSDPGFGIPANANDTTVNDLATPTDDESDESNVGTDDVLGADTEISAEPGSLAFAPLALELSNDGPIGIAQVEQVPEPVTLALLGIGLAGLGFSLRKRS
jgi:hypothetical protein